MNKLTNCAAYILFLGIFAAVLICGLLYVFGSYTITLDLGDGSEPLRHTYSIATGDVTLGIPEKKGYRFTGWTGDNGAEEQIDVVIPAGTLGNKRYLAHWSNKLTVICQDWVVDAKGNLVADISDEIDEFLLDGRSSQGAEYKGRALKVKAGKKVDPSVWGTSSEYKAYSNQYTYIGNSGVIKVEEDRTVVYRYFYPVLDIDYLVDGVSPSELGLSNADIARFNLYIDGKLAYSGRYDIRKEIPCNSWYYVEVVRTSAEFEHVITEEEFGQMGLGRTNTNISFVTRTGDHSARCLDYLVDAEGTKVKDITNEVDAYLRQQKKSDDYVAPRTIAVNDGDIIGGELWGDDTKAKAYHGKYCYVGSSGDITVEGGDVTVYRFFYPTIDIKVTVDGMIDKKAAKNVKFDFYVDGKRVGEGIHEYTGPIPYGSSYEIRNATSDKGYVYVPAEKDSGIMGDKSLTLKLAFVSVQ